ncbi:MAG: DUF3540 domain-containing protein [Myxococcota bacterium]
MTLSSPHPTPSDPTRAIWSEGGARASLDHDPAGGEQLSVFDAENRLLFQYDAGTGRGSISMSHGDLTIAAPRGDIRLVAGKAVRCVSAGEIALDSATGVDLRVRGGRRTSSVRVGPEAVRVATSAVTVDTDRAGLDIRHLHLAGETVKATFHRAHAVLDEVETVAGRVLVRAEELYERIDRLRDLRAGRWRALVSGALELSGTSTKLVATDDLRLTGDRIHLTGATS